MFTLTPPPPPPQINLATTTPEIAANFNTRSYKMPAGVHSNIK